MKFWKLGHLRLMGLSPIRSHVTYVGFELRNPPLMVSFKLRDRPVAAPPCPDHDNLGRDFARILAAAQVWNGGLAALLERMVGMFTEA